MVLLYLVVGGSLGTLARYGLSGWVQQWAGASFPWGTLVVNVAGSFLLGFLMRTAETSSMSPEVRVGTTIGFCGAFTTFSTVSFEAFALVRKAHYARALGYGLGNLGLGFVAAVLGYIAAAWLMESGT